MVRRDSANRFLALSDANSSFSGTPDRRASRYIMMSGMRESMSSPSVLRPLPCSCGA